jgi:hypothetical protein
MRFLSLPLTLVAIGAAALAQTTQPSLKTLTDFGVYAKAGTTGDYEYVAKDTQVLRPLAVAAGVEGASATSDASLMVMNGAVAVVVGEKGNAAVRDASGAASAGTSASNDPRNVVPGPHSLLLVVPLKKDAKANVVVHFEGHAANSAATADVAIDIGNDDKVEFKQVADGKPYHMEFPVVATDQGVVVKITTNGQVNQKGTGTSDYGAMTSVKVATGMGGGRCSFEVYGKTCGPKMTGVEEHHQMETIVVLTVVGAHPSSLAAILFGTERLEAQFPGTQCFLNLKPLLALPHQISERGHAELRFLLPPNITLSLLTQDAIFFRGDRGLTVESTNGLGLSCK